MARWLASGLRRDVCVVIFALGEPTGQSVKRALEDRYDASISPSEFYDALSSLLDRGFVDSRTDGVHDRYWLTESGEDLLLSHYEWMQEQIDRR